MFVKLFNPFNMIFPFAGRQKACQLSCVPFPSISGKIEFNKNGFPVVYIYNSCSCAFYITLTEN